MASFQAYNSFMVCQEDNISNCAAGGAVLGYSVHCRYPSYRGTFLSCIEGIELRVDGRRVPDESIFFHLNGKQCLLCQMKDLYLEYWFILDKAKLFVLQEGGLAKGNHEVTITMRHRIPYTGYFGSYLVLEGSDTKTLTVVSSEEASS